LDNGELVAEASRQLGVGEERRAERDVARPARDHVQYVLC
jgi:hypothetical protein